MSMRKTGPVFVAMVLGASIVSAGAQETGPGAGYEPLGVRAGSFIVLPSLTTSATYSDNIYRTQNNTEDDLILTVQPQVLAESTWSRHALNLHAGMQSRFYDSNSSEDHTNWRIGADGSSISRAIQISSPRSNMPDRMRSVASRWRLPWPPSQRLFRR